MTSETTLELAHSVSNIIGVKEASGNLEQIMEIISRKPNDFLVISGDDALTLPHIACGGDGVISVVANAFPKRFSSMVSHALMGELEKLDHSTMNFFLSYNSYLLTEIQEGLNMY